MRINAVTTPSMLGTFIRAVTLPYKSDLVELTRLPPFSFVKESTSWLSEITG